MPDICAEQSWREPVASWMSPLMTDRTAFSMIRQEFPYGTDSRLFVQGSELQVLQDLLNRQTQCIVSWPVSPVSGTNLIEKMHTVFSSHVHQCQKAQLHHQYEVQPSWWKWHLKNMMNNGWFCCGIKAFAQTGWLDGCFGNRTSRTVSGALFGLPEIQPSSWRMPPPLLCD